MGMSLVLTIPPSVSVVTLFSLSSQIGTVKRRLKNGNRSLFFPCHVCQTDQMANDGHTRPLDYTLQDLPVAQILFHIVTALRLTFVHSGGGSCPSTRLEVGKGLSTGLSR